MKVMRAAATGLLVVVLFAALAALAMASPPSGNPSGGCGHGPPNGIPGPPGGQYGGPNPPGSQYGGGVGGSGGPPQGCPPPGTVYHP